MQLWGMSLLNCKGTPLHFNYYIIYATMRIPTLSCRAVSNAKANQHQSQVYLQKNIYRTMFS